jgi:hypothetical protein
VPAAQTVPHPPQLVLLVAVSTHAPAQSVYPAAQVHAAAVHTSFAPHVAPHRLQLFLSFCRSTHVFPHFVFGAEQPAEQLEMPLTVLHTSPGSQASPQAPQLAALVERLSQTPAAFPGPGPFAAPGQVVSPVGQVQAPSVQVAPVGHAAPHAPQFAALVLVSMHSVPPPPGPPCTVQRVWPLAQPVVQPLLTHVSAPMQRFPQPPQLALLLVVSTHWLLQEVRLPLHTHSPFEQLAPLPQALLQAPQLLGSLSVLTQAPPQLVCPPSVSHSRTHWPPEQTPPSHLFPHPPQLFGSLSVS